MQEASLAQPAPAVVGVSAVVGEEVLQVCHCLVTLAAQNWQGSIDDQLQICKLKLRREPALDFFRHLLGVHAAQDIVGVIVQRLVHYAGHLHPMRVMTKKVNSLVP